MRYIRSRGAATEAGRGHSPRLGARSLRRAVFAVGAVLVLGLLGTAAAVYTKGYRIWIVHTGSMEPGYRPGDVVVDRPPSHSYTRGEVITFRHSDLTTDVVTHRVTAVLPDGSIRTKGDANRTADVWAIRPDQVQGSVMFRVRSLGYVLMFLRQPTGVAAVVASGVAIGLLWSLFFPANETARFTNFDEAQPHPAH
jgi:signal peptidase